MMLDGINRVSTSRRLRAALDDGKHSAASNSTAISTTKLTLRQNDDTQCCCKCLNPVTVGSRATMSYDCNLPSLALVRMWVYSLNNAGDDHRVAGADAHVFRLKGVKLFQ